MTRMQWLLVVLLTQGSLLFGISAGRSAAADRVFRAGAAAVDISPQKLPAIVSGGFLQGRGEKINDPLFARCLVLDDGATRLAIVVVDSLMMPRELLDNAKRQAQQATGLRADRILVSAIHTHSAPSVMGALGTGVDEDYARRLPGWIAQSVAAALKNLAPAKVGWGAIADSEDTHCRRWIYRPDRMRTDPFGEKSVRAMMHPGYQNPDCIGPAGPVDPGLTVLAVASPQGRPVALVANYSMHYFGAAPISADYFGRFCRKMAGRLDADSAQPPFVAMMSQGTAGDLHWMDYGQPRKSISIDSYSDRVTTAAFEATRKIQYRPWVPLAMAEDRLTLRRRAPDAKRLAWARAIVDGMKGRTLAATQREVYALEQVYLHNEPQRELLLQAIRVGDLGITAIPDEVFGITGLKIKAQSPLEPTFNVELANGAEGYIPPPEQHTLGGYTTWPARTAGLEVQAEPRIVEKILQLLERVAGKPRRRAVEPTGPYTAAVLASKPVAYWRLGEFAGPQAKDAVEQGGPATYEDPVALYLEGPEGTGFCAPGQTARAAHFAGGRVKGSVASLGPACTLEAWFWNGLPANARPITGTLFALASQGTGSDAADELGIGGTGADAGKLFFSGGTPTIRLSGVAEIPLRTWNHVVVVRDGSRVAVYLNGNPKPEIAGEAVPGRQTGARQVLVGGGKDASASFEGKIAEVAVYGRALGADEIARHYAAARIKQ